MREKRPRRRPSGLDGLVDRVVVGPVEVVHRRGDDRVGLGEQPAPERLPPHRRGAEHRARQAVRSGLAAGRPLGDLDGDHRAPSDRAAATGISATAPPSCSLLPATSNGATSPGIAELAASAGAASRGRVAPRRRSRYRSRRPATAPAASSTRGPGPERRPGRGSLLRHDVARQDGAHHRRATRTRRATSARPRPGDRRRSRSSCARARSGRSRAPARSAASLPSVSHIAPIIAPGAGARDAAHFDTPRLQLGEHPEVGEHHGCRRCRAPVPPPQSGDRAAPSSRALATRVDRPRSPPGRSPTAQTFARRRAAHRYLSVPGCAAAAREPRRRRLAEARRRSAPSPPGPLRRRAAPCRRCARGRR